MENIKLDNFCKNITVLDVDLIFGVMDHEVGFNGIMVNLTPDHLFGSAPHFLE